MGIDRELLLYEKDKIEFNPHRIAGDPPPPESWWAYQESWHNGIIQSVKYTPHLAILIAKLELIMGERYLDGYDLEKDKINVRFYLQLANTELPEHADHPTANIALNIKLTDNTAPLTFSEIGDVSYTACLFNTVHRHSVKSSPVDRIILRITPRDIPYDHFYECFKKAGWLF